MYGLIRQGLPRLSESGEKPHGRLRDRISPNVVLLGLTSLFTDIGAEMVNTVLPIYLLYALRVGTLSFGILDGLYQGAPSLLGLGAGAVADRFQRHKQVAALGYATSAVCKLGLIAAGSSVGALTAVIFLDRTGKGIRTAPRDALISLSTAGRDLGFAFGVHRALDTAGAFLGPLAAFVLLTALPGNYNGVFVTSFCVSLVGLGVIALFVRDRDGVTRAVVRIRDLAALVRIPSSRRLALVGGAFAVFTISDSFLYIALQRHLAFSIGFFPLLYVGTSLFYMLLAIPLGRLADRVGRMPVFVAGHVLLLAVYASLLLPTLGGLEVGAVLVLFGAFYAATDGVLMAAASALLPENGRTVGLAGLTTIDGLGSLLSSLLMGAIWTWVGVGAAVTLFGVGLILSAAMAMIVLRRRA